MKSVRWLLFVWLFACATTIFPVITENDDQVGVQVHESGCVHHMTQHADGSSLEVVYYQDLPIATHITLANGVEKTALLIPFHLQSKQRPMQLGQPYKGRIKPFKKGENRSEESQENN